MIFHTFYLLFFISVAFSYELPKSCKITDIKLMHTINQYENSFWTQRAVKCDVNGFFHFDFDQKSPYFKEKRNCTVVNDKYLCEVIFLQLEWPKNELIVLDKNFNISQMLIYIEYFRYRISINFCNFNGVDINLMGDDKQLSSMMIETKRVFKADVYNTQLDFYIDKKLVKSCSDILMSGKLVRSIFQIERVFKIVSLYFVKYKNALCPLIFNNTVFKTVFINSMTNSFYKKNVMKFSNEKLDNIYVSFEALNMNNIENIDLDMEFLNRYVFKELSEILISGYVNLVANELFFYLRKLRLIIFEKVHFRKMIHKNGIGWIKEINKNLTVELTDTNQIKIYEEDIKIIGLSSQQDSLLEESLSKALPDKDFCLYKDFPFKQLVFVIENSYFKTSDFSCTYFWLLHHLVYFKDYYSDINITQVYAQTFYDGLFLKMIKHTQSNLISNESISRCDFKKRLELCNKTNYQIQDIWSTIDTEMLNKKLQIAFKISSYFVSFFGIFTNILVIVVILNKNNADLFNGYKQYSYLWLNSLSGVIILAINLLSWTTECFYPFQVFCPETRTYYFFQYFKIIFKGIFSSSLNFMCNFTYIAFAFNRVNTIDKEAKFLTEFGIKKYIGLTFFISLLLSSMKFFKYTVNPGIPYANYPLPNEWDILSRTDNSILIDCFFVINSISDILNYVVFSFVCLFIDIYMIVVLRKTLANKLKKIEKLYKNDILAVKLKENEDVLKKAIQMVIINNALSLCFKMPSSFLPLINAYAQFFYQKSTNTYSGFSLFYSSLFYTGFFGQFINLCEFIYNISIAIQFFIYYRFDKKIHTAIERLFNFDKKNIQ